MEIIRNIRLRKTYRISLVIVIVLILVVFYTNIMKKTITKESVQRVSQTEQWSPKAVVAKQWSPSSGRQAVVAKQWSPKAVLAKQCSPKDTIMFIKTHKTGSSTMTNILNRYGYKRNLSIALPKNGYAFEWPKRFNPNTMVNQWTRPNILCNHARFGEKIRFVFPKELSVYVTIIREPIKQYESTFVFFGMQKYLGMTGKNTDVLEKYLQSVSSLKSARMDRADRGRLLRNPMIYDLGLDFRYYQDKKAVTQYIEFLDKEFDLVMIMDYFDESLILLKRLLCCDMDDIVFVKQNVRLGKDLVSNLSASVQANIRRWNQADGLLFDHFNKTLWKKIAQEGPGFYDDLKNFRRRQKEVYDLCISQYKNTEIYKGKVVLGPNLKSNISEKHRTFCEELVTDELVFCQKHLNSMKQKQKQKQAAINMPLEFENEFSEENDWDKAKDLAYHAILP